jgi:hypothetical protein
MQNSSTNSNGNLAETASGISKKTMHHWFGYDEWVRFLKFHPHPSKLLDVSRSGLHPEVVSFYGQGKSVIYIHMASAVAVRVI